MTQSIMERMHGGQTNVKNLFPRFSILDPLPLFKMAKWPADRGKLHPPLKQTSTCSPSASFSQSKAGSDAHALKTRLPVYNNSDQIDPWTTIFRYLQYKHKSG